jgi:hypothetical protein
MIVLACRPAKRRVGFTLTPVAGRGVLEHPLQNLVTREGYAMPSRFGVPRFNPDAILLPVYQRRGRAVSTLSGFMWRAFS